MLVPSSPLVAENKIKSKEKINTSSAEKRPGIEKKRFQNVDIFRLVMQGFNKGIDIQRFNKEIDIQGFYLEIYLEIDVLRSELYVG